MGLVSTRHNPADRMSQFINKRALRNPIIHGNDNFPVEQCIVRRLWNQNIYKSRDGKILCWRLIGFLFMVKFSGSFLGNVVFPFYEFVSSFCVLGFPRTGSSVLSNLKRRSSTNCLEDNADFSLLTVLLFSHRSLRQWSCVTVENQVGRRAVYVRTTTVPSYTTGMVILAIYLPPPLFYICFKEFCGHLES